MDQGIEQILIVLGGNVWPVPLWWQQLSTPGSWDSSAWLLDAGRSQHRWLLLSLPPALPTSMGAKGPPPQIPTQNISLNVFFGRKRFRRALYTFQYSMWKKVVLLFGNFQMLFRKMSVKELLLLPTVPSTAFEAIFHFKQLRYQDQGSSTSLQCLLEAIKNQPNNNNKGNTSDSYQESILYSKIRCVYFWRN